MSEEIKKEEEVKVHNHISFSEYTNYKWCPYQWSLKYILGHKEDTNEFLVFGSALHKSIEEIILKNPNRFTYTKLFADKLKAESNTVFSNSYFGKSLGSDGSQLLNKLDFFSRFKNWEPIKDNENNIIGIEEALYEPLVITEDGTQLFFKGFIDFAAKHKIEDKHMVLDWKSALKPWDLDKKIGDMDFNYLYNKIQSKEQLSLKEMQNLMSKVYFGQLVLYKHFYSLKHNVPIEKIITRYCVLTRQPIDIIQYELEDNSNFTNYIVEDMKKVALEIYEFKKTLSKELDKAKFQPYLKDYCKYCKLKSEC